MGGLPQPGDSFGRYEILRRIGRGAMGVVFAARQVDLGREVALKVLSSDLADSPEYRNRFTREAAVLGRIDSPHVIHVYEAGEHAGWLYIATQLVQGGDLQQWMKANGPLTPYAAVDLVTQVAIGLRDAHQLGVLHRDIKPSNVLLKQTDDGLRAYLCDLGISQLLDAEHTRTTGVIGTLGYMAPERHEGKDASVASDVYGLGCLLWAGLTSEAPYLGTDMNVALAHVREPVRQLDTNEPGTAQINQVLARSMAKAPQERYPDVSSMIADLRAALVAVGSGVAEETSVRPGPTVPVTPPPAPVAVTRKVEPPVPEVDQFTMVRQPPPVPPGPPVVGSSEPSRRRRWLVLGALAVVLLGGGGALWAVLARDNPVADAIARLDGEYASYTLGSKSAECAAEKLVAASTVRSDDLARQLDDAWPNIGRVRAQAVAAAVMACSDAVYEQIVADTVASHDPSSTACIERGLGVDVVTQLLTLELSGAGEKADDRVVTLVNRC